MIKNEMIVASVPKGKDVSCDGAEKIRAALRREVSASFCERGEEAALHLARLDGPALTEAARMAQVAEKQYFRRFSTSCAAAALSLPVAAGVALAGSNTWQGATLGIIFAASTIFNAARIGGVVAENRYRSDQGDLLRTFEAMGNGHVPKAEAPARVVTLPVVTQMPVALCA